MSEPADSLSIPSGYVRIDLPADPPRGAREAWHKASTGRTVITGEPGDGDDAAPEYEAHNCDEMGCGWDHVLEIREPAPGDSTGARCAVYAVEAGPVDDIDAGPHLAHWMVYAEDDFDVIAVDEAGAIERVEIEHGPVTGAVVFRISADSDGTPDTLPAVDACAALPL
jgi:hypothetical protein